MPRLLLGLLLCVLATAPAAATEMRIQRDVPYATPDDTQRTLDVYAPAKGDNYRIVVWIHGGGWRRGDKAAVHDKPQAFTDRGCIGVDTAAYDLPRQIATIGRLRQGTYRIPFTDDAEQQQQLSPLHHVRRAAAQSANAIPPFLILHVADRRDSGEQSRALAAALQKAGVEATVVPVPDRTHGTINRRLGERDEPATEAVFQFLGEVANQGRQSRTTG